MSDFTSEQVAPVLDAIKAVYSTVNSNWGSVYQAIYDLANKYSDVDPNVLNWINGAKGVNTREGAFAAYIRDYTANQYFYRSGSQLDEGLLNSASNSIASHFAYQFLFNSKPPEDVSLSDFFSDPESTTPAHLLDPTIPSIRTIGGIDAGGVASNIFKRNGADGSSPTSTGEANFSPWAGTVLFTQLGVSDYFKNWMLQPDGNHVWGETQGAEGVKVESGAYDLISAAQDSVQLATADRFAQLAQDGGLFTLGQLKFRNSAAITDAKDAAASFVQKMYGDEASIYSLGTSIFEPEIAFLQSNDAYKVGLVAGDELEAKEGTRFLVGGPGDDYVSSDVFKAPYFETSDPSAPPIPRNADTTSTAFLDGGAGYNGLEYFNESTPLQVHLQNEGYWNFRYKIDGGSDFRTDYAYEFQKLDLNGSGDTVIWDKDFDPTKIKSENEDTDIKITEHGTRTTGANTLDLSNVSAGMTLDGGDAVVGGIRFSGFDVLKGPSVGGTTYDIRGSADGLGINNYISTGKNDTFNVNYADDNASSVLLSSLAGGASFNFTNMSASNLTAVWDGAGGNTYNINSGLSDYFNIVKVNMDGLTADNISKINVSTLGDYLGYGNNTLYILNASADDKIIYNGKELSTPTWTEMGTSTQDAKYAGGRDYRVYDGLNVGKSLYDPSVDPAAPVAVIDTTWTVVHDVDTGYGLTAGGLFYTTSGPLEVHTITGEQTGGYGDDGNRVVDKGVALSDGSLTISGFKEGDFGVERPSSGLIGTISYHREISDVQSWAEADTTQFTDAYGDTLYGVSGKTPGSLTNTQVTDDLASYFFDRSSEPPPFSSTRTLDAANFLYGAAPIVDTPTTPPPPPPFPPFILS